MGLDVYLVRCNKWEKYEEILSSCRVVEEADYEQFKAQYPGHYGEWTEEVRALYGEMSNRNDKRVSDAMLAEGITKEDVDEPSNLYPEEHFRIGYFRSSYNDSGINNVANTYGLPGLYDIFEAEEAEYLEVDWEAAKVAVEDAIQKWDAFINSDRGRYAALEVRGFSNSPALPPSTLSPNGIPEYTVPSSKKDALEIFSKKRREYVPREGHMKMDQYSCREGFFAMEEPLKVAACIPGKPAWTFAGGSDTATYLILDLGTSGYGYYLKCMEIVKETIDHVLSHENPREFRLIWSG